MSHKLTVRAFFFNATTDYLPYYKNFTLVLENDATAKSIPQAIKAQNELFSYPKLNLVFKINDLVVEEDTPVTSIIKRLGTKLQIDPVSSYRANNGLIINDNDFMQSFELLAPYMNDSDKTYYKGLYALHYASETSNFERNYIGDAILLLAHSMITKGTQYEDAILEAISSPYSGLFDCEYENNLFNTAHHEAEINALKMMLKPASTSSFFSKLKSRFSKRGKEEDIVKRISKVKTIENLLEKNIGYYQGSYENDALQKLLEETNLKKTSFPMENKLCGSTLIKDNKDLALKKAGARLLDGYDAGVEVLVIEHIIKYEMLSKNFSKIEKYIGRKMLGFELIYVEDFVAQLNAIEA